MTWTAAMPRCRPFKLIDVMIWVATAAAWMALMRPRWDQFQRVWTATRKVPPWQSYLGIDPEWPGPFPLVAAHSFFDRDAFDPAPPTQVGLDSVSRSMLFPSIFRSDSLLS